MANTVLLEDCDRVAHVDMNRPEKLDSINNEMLGDLFETFTEVKENPDIWVTVLTGAGRAFCTGHDLVIGRAEPRGDTDDFYTFSSKVWKPVIAAVNAYCLGQGGGLALLSDIRIASEDAEFGWPQVGRGIASISGPTILSYYVPLGPGRRFCSRGSSSTHKRPIGWACCKR